MQSNEKHLKYWKKYINENTFKKQHLSSIQNYGDHVISPLGINTRSKKVRSRIHPDPDPMESEPFMGQYDPEPVSG